MITWKHMRSRRIQSLADDFFWYRILSMLLICLTFHYIIFALAIICTLRSILHHLTIQNNLHSLCQYLLISSYIYTPITSTYVTLKICFPYFCVEVSFSQLISHKISRYPTPYMYFHTQFKPRSDTRS